MSRTSETGRKEESSEDRQREARVGLYVGALPFGANVETVRKLFEPFGPIFSVSVNANWENPTDEPHAFVELKNIKEAIEKMDGKKIGNTYLRVHEGGSHE
ncbi:MAG: RNA-binding protein [Elusimicrobia bacterium]|nr:RNA-binding protein [Elusimicrobiota bacterium]